MGKIKVGVIFGGKSVEHEVSIISAIQAINKMDEDKYDVVPIYINITPGKLNANPIIFKIQEQIFNKLFFI